MPKPPSRAQRRALKRLVDREIRQVVKTLASSGVYARISAVAAVVHPTAGSQLFWHAFKSQIAARELLGPITTPEAVRDIAVKLLRDQHGIDLDGIVLKATITRPGPQIFFEAVPAVELAHAALAEARTSERGQRRAAKMAALARG
jgi:hypothetical protein